MKINFNEQNNKYVKLLEFLNQKFNRGNILSFEGNVSENGLPVGVCTIEIDSNSPKVFIKKIEFNLNDKQKLEGEAIVTYKDGNTAKFDFLKDNFAVIQYANGVQYRGSVKNFMKEGDGFLYTINGERFKGNFQNNLQNGIFEVEYKDGIKGEVNFVNGKIDGEVYKKLQNDMLLHALYDKGVLIHAEYTGSTITGTTLKYVMNSKVKKPFYEITGECEIYLNDTLYYSGDVNKCSMNGCGTAYYTDGSYFIGEFVNGKMDGEGKIYNKDNKLIKHGIWQNNKFIKSLQEENSLSSNETSPVKLTQNNNCKVPLQINDQYDIIKLKDALQNVEKNIIGQESAINQIANNVLLAFLCEREENKPLTSILMTGPTGVGKTETAKQISKHLFGKAPYVVDFSNFFGEHMLASLIGAPSGYKGYDEEPALLQYITENEKTGGVILFDELDKADEECYNIFMRMLDEGEIISAKNIPYKLNNFVIISTTNMSANHTRKLGFSKNGENDVKDSLVKSSTGLKKEQVARYGLVVEYQPLSRENKIELCKNAIESTIKKVKGIKSYNIEFDINDEIIGNIVDNTNESFGVREIKNQAAKAITSKLAEFIRHSGKRNLKVKINSLEDVEIVELKESKKKEIINEK